MKRLNTIVVASQATLRRILIPVIALVITSFTYLPYASAADTELIINGSFEQPVVTSPKGWTTYFGQNYSGLDTCPLGDTTCNDGTLIPGWSGIWTDTLVPGMIPEPGRIEIQSDRFPIIANCPARIGFQKAELDSHHRLNNPDNNVTIFQPVPTCPGLPYTLKFSWKGRLDIDHDSDLDVLIDDIVIGHETLFSLHWNDVLYHFTAGQTGLSMLAFQSVGMGDTLGAFVDAVSVIGEDGSDPEVCPAPENICADGKPISLTLLYDGNDDTLNNQTSDEVIIDPMVVANYPDPAYIVIYGQNKKRPALFAGTFAIGDLITVTGPRKRIPPRLKFEIYSLNDLVTPVQTVQFHTSCSQPLSAGDEFGAITVWSATQ